MDQRALSLSGKVNWGSSIHSLVLVIFPCRLLFSQLCLFIWWQRYQRGTVEGGIMRISWFIFFYIALKRHRVFSSLHFSDSSARLQVFAKDIPGSLGWYASMSWRSLFFRGYWCLRPFMWMCSCLPGWHSRTFGCNPLPWRITGSGRSRASAWQRSRGLRITAEMGGVCVWMCASEYVCVCVCTNPQRRRLIPLAIKPTTSLIPPKTVLCLMLATDSAAVSTVQLGRWQCPFGVVWRRERRE